jgi:hypothetical protein
MEKLSAKEICDSKKKYSLIAVQHVTSQENSCCKSYYECPVCKQYHIYTTNKVVSAKRNAKFKNFDNETYQAMKHRKERKGYNKRF